MFSSGGPSVRFLTRYVGEVSEPLVGRQGSRVSMRVARKRPRLLRKKPRPLRKKLRLLRKKPSLLRKRPCLLRRKLNWQSNCLQKKRVPASFMKTDGSATRATTT